MSPRLALFCLAAVVAGAVIATYAASLARPGKKAAPEAKQDAPAPPVASPLDQPVTGPGFERDVRPFAAPADGHLNDDHLEAYIESQNAVRERGGSPQSHALTRGMGSLEYSWIEARISLALASLRRLEQQSESERLRAELEREVATILATAPDDSRRLRLEAELLELLSAGRSTVRESEADLFNRQVVQRHLDALVAATSPKPASPSPAPELEEGEEWVPLAAGTSDKR